MPPTPERPFGSISYPSVAIAFEASVETFVERFQSLPVDDRVASNATFLYVEARKRRARAIVEAEMEQRLSPAGDLRAARDAYWHAHPDAMESWLRRDIYIPAEQDAYERAYASLGGPSLPGSGVVDIVRAAAAYRFRGLLPEQEQFRLQNIAVPVGTRQMTIGEMRNTYLTDDWIAQALTDTDVRLEAAMLKAAEAIERAAER